MSSDRFVWVDTETFGLEPDRDPILEVGIRITDLDLKTIDEMSVLVWEPKVYHRKFSALMSEAIGGDESAKYVLDIHNKSDLWSEAEADGETIEDAIEILKDWLESHDVENEPMCGSSVHFDRSMLAAQMPDIHEFFSHRDVDVSSLKELCKRLNPDMYEGQSEDLTQQKLHRVLPDLQDTIDEAQWYFDNFLYLPGQ